MALHPAALRGRGEHLSLQTRQTPADPRVGCGLPPPDLSPHFPSPGSPWGVSASINVVRLWPFIAPSPQVLAPVPISFSPLSQR